MQPEGRNIGILLLAWCLMFVSASGAFAYALPESADLTATRTPAAPAIDFNWGRVLNNLSSPFQNFSQNLQSAANTPISNFSFNASSVPAGVPIEAQNAWTRFDNWLSGVSGFHGSDIFGFAGRAFAWTLNVLGDLLHWAASRV